MPERQGRGPIPALAIGQGNPSPKQSGPSARLIGLPFTRCRWVRLAPNMGNSERPVAGFFPIAPRGRVAVHPRPNGVIRRLHRRTAGALPETFTRCGRNAAKKNGHESRRWRLNRFTPIVGRCPTLGSCPAFGAAESSQGGKDPFPAFDQSPTKIL
jgi:hypothetical protein